MIDRPVKDGAEVARHERLLRQSAHEPSTTGRTLEKRTLLITLNLVLLKRETADRQNGFTITRMTTPTISTAGTSLMIR